MLFRSPSTMSWPPSSTGAECAPAASPPSSPPRSDLPAPGLSSRNASSPSSPPTSTAALPRPARSSRPAAPSSPPASLVCLQDRAPPPCSPWTPPVFSSGQASRWPPPQAPPVAVLHASYPRAQIHPLPHACHSPLVLPVVVLQCPCSLRPLPEHDIVARRQVLRSRSQRPVQVLEIGRAHV